MKKILFIPFLVFCISCSSDSAKKSDSSNSVGISYETIFERTEIELKNVIEEIEADFEQFKILLTNEIQESALINKPAVAYQPGSYNLLADRSKVSWLGTELTTNTHFGSLRAQSGNLKIDNKGGVTGKIAINMQSILVEDLKGRSKEVLENHLKSDDFFGTNNFPTATLEFRSLNRYNNDGDHIFKGDLTIKGITNEVEFSAKLIRQIFSKDIQDIKKQANDQIEAKEEEIAVALKEKSLELQELTAQHVNIFRSAEIELKNASKKIEIEFQQFKVSLMNEIHQMIGLHAVGKLVFDRSKYNVRFRSGSFFDNLGDKLILDDIEVDISLIAEPA